MHTAHRILRDVHCTMSYACNNNTHNTRRTRCSWTCVQVVGQAGCTRAQAVTALKNNDNDIVNAIMEMTM